MFFQTSYNKPALYFFNILLCFFIKVVIRFVIKIRFFINIKYYLLYLSFKNRSYLFHYNFFCEENKILLFNEGKNHKKIIFCIWILGTNPSNCFIKSVYGIYIHYAWWFIILKTGSKYYISYKWFYNMSPYSRHKIIKYH